jgi:hypothetical protein
MLRNGVIQSLGNIIIAISKKESVDDKENAKDRDKYIEIIEERVVDVASYTRSKTLQTLIQIVQYVFLFVQSKLWH